MSNTTITPTIGAATLSGVALAMGLGIAPGMPTLNFTGNSSAMSPTTAQQASTDSGTSLTVSWLGLQNGFVGTATTPRIYSQTSIQVSGTFGSGGSVSIQG